MLIILVVTFINVKFLLLLLVVCKYIIQEQKRKFDKTTSKFCQSLDKYLGLKQNKTTDNQLQEVGTLRFHL